jgi:hypothetical protein
MTSDFFEVSLDRLPVKQLQQSSKYSKNDIQRMSNSLQEVQQLIDEGKTGEEILSYGDRSDNLGVANTYQKLYSQEGADRIKLALDSQGNLECINGNHRIQAAREQGLSHIPASVNADFEGDSEALDKFKKEHKSGRDISRFNPKKEQQNLDNKHYSDKLLPLSSTNSETESTMRVDQPRYSQKKAEIVDLDDITSMKEPNIDTKIHETIERGKEKGAGPSSDLSSDSTNFEDSAEGDDIRPISSLDGDTQSDRIRQTDQPGDFTPELMEAQAVTDSLKGSYGQNQDIPETQLSSPAESIPVSDATPSNGDRYSYAETAKSTDPKIQDLKDRFGIEPSSFNSKNSAEGGDIKPTNPLDGDTQSDRIRQTDQSGEAQAATDNLKGSYGQNQDISETQSLPAESIPVSDTTPSSSDGYDCA